MSESQTMVEAARWAALGRPGFFMTVLSADFRIIDMNEQLSQAFSMTPQAAVNQDFLHLCEQLHIASPITASDDFFQLLPLRITTNLSINDHILFIDWHICSLLGEQGNPQTLVLTGIDITEQQKAEESKKKAMAYFKYIINYVPHYIFWKDVNSVFLGCNRLFADAAGLSDPDDVIGKTDYDLPWQKHESDAYVADDRQVISSQCSKLNIEEQQTLNDGREITLLTSKVPLYDLDNKVSGVLAVYTDITDRKKMEAELRIAKEAAEAANEAKSDFIANMSHDLRTPLVAICGIAEILKFDQDFNAPSRAELASDLANAGQVLLHLVDSILEFSRIKSDKIPLVAESFDLRDAIERIVSMMAEQANRKDIKLLVYYSESCPRYLIADPQRVNRIVTNLLSNAIKFTDKGHVMVSVELITQREGEVDLQIVVEDTGIGIPIDKVGFIFDRFYRVDASAHGRYSGTGLGLNIVKQFVESLGGTIGINSQLGCGATFHCSIPFKLPNAIEVKSTWLRHYGSIPILIVDDYKSRGKLLLRQLHSNDACLTNSAQVQNVLEQAKNINKSYQIIIVDDEIQHISPEDLITWLREDELYSQSLTLLFVNPNNSRSVIRYREAGYTECVVKPIQPTELTSVLTKSWQRWSSRFQNDETALRQFAAKVLLIEDNAVSLKVLRIMLEQLNCQVDVSATAQLGIAALQSKEYDLVFLDLGLPDIDGLTLAKKIKAMQNPHCRIPLIALTAHLSELDRRRCLDAGMVGYLRKPCSSQGLKNMLLKILFHQ